MAKLSQQSSQAKGQKSISSFFTPKSTQAPQPSQSSPPAPEVAESSDTESVRPKRALADDASGGNGAVERAAKRLKGDVPEIATRGPRPSPRTEKYVYTGSSQITSQDAIIEVDEDEAADKAKKKELHERWMKKMSGAQVGRRWNTEETHTAEDGDVDADDGEEEEATPVKTKKKGAKTGKLTPLEIQVLDIKRKHMDTLLIIEVGYKFKFFGEDARTAAKELSIVCIPGKFRFDEREYYTQT